MAKIVTNIAIADATSITVRGRDLVNELIGKHTYTEMIYFLTVGRMPSAGETRVLDACLVTLMEHGFTPAALVSRLMAESVPDQIQVSIAAGLLAVGSVHAGTMEGCAALLQAGVEAADKQEWCRRVVEDHATGCRPAGVDHRCRADPGDRQSAIRDDPRGQALRGPTGPRRTTRRAGAAWPGPVDGV